MTTRPHPVTSRGIDRFLAHRRAWEVGAVLVLLSVTVLANTHTVWQDLARAGRATAWADVWWWEATSALAWCALLPPIGLWLRRVELRPTWRCAGAHLLGAATASAAHVALMVAQRLAIYAAQGRRYDFGAGNGLGAELLYEALKDIRTYAAIVVIWSLYAHVLRRWAGQARLPAPDRLTGLTSQTSTDAPSDASSAATSDTSPTRVVGPAALASPLRFELSERGATRWLPAADVLWCEAQGNYVALHTTRGRQHLLRITLSTLLQRLHAAEPGVFVRCHRSHLVRAQAITAVTPTAAGDAQLQLSTGQTVPCSRLHLASIRLALGSGGSL